MVLAIFLLCYTDNLVHEEDVDTVEYFSGYGAASSACRASGDVVVSFDRDHGRHMDLTSCSGFACGR